MPRTRCPVCGRGFVGKLKAHLEANAAEGRADGAVTRCEWNLFAARVEGEVARLKRDGWVRADSVAARTISTLADEELAIYGPTGNVSLWVSASAMDPKNWPRVWWVRPWVRALGEMPVPMVLRRQLIREAKLASQAVRDAIEATYRIGGAHALAEMGVDVIKERCPAAYGGPRVVSRGTTKPHDQCLLPAGHEGGHKGLRGTRWT